MATSKDIQLNIDEGPLNKLRQQAETIYAGMIRDNREIETSAEATLRLTEEQIQALDRRNKLDEEYARSQIAQQRSAGNITESQATQQISAVESESQQGRIMIELLRELTETTRETSREEIRNDREGIERLVRTDERLNQLGIGDMDPFEALRRGLQSEYFASGQEPPGAAAVGGGGGRGGRAGKRFEEITKTLAGAENPYFLAADIIGSIPTMAGAGVALNRLLTSAQGYEGALSTRAQLTGTSISGVRGEERRITQADVDAVQNPREKEKLQKLVGKKIGSAEKGYLDFAGTIGMDIAEQMNVHSDYDRSFMRSMSMDQFKNSLAIQKSFGLSSGDVTGALGVSRYDPSATGGNTGFGKIATLFERYLSDTGQQNYMMQEILQTYTSTANSILQEVGGQINQTRLAGNISGIAQATGFRGVNLNRAVGGIRQMGKSTNPVQRAKMLYAFSQRNPGKSLFEVEAMMENPLEHLDEVGDYFSGIERQFGRGSDLSMYEMASSMNLSNTQMLALDKSRKGGKSWPESLKDALNISKKEQKGLVEDDYTKSVADKIGTLTKSSANVESYVQMYGAELVEGITGVVETIKEGNKKRVEQQDMQMEELAKQGKTIEAMNVRLQTIAGQLR